MNTPIIYHNIKWDPKRDVDIYLPPTDHGSGPDPVRERTIAIETHTKLYA